MRRKLPRGMSHRERSIGGIVARRYAGRIGNVAQAMSRLGQLIKKSQQMLRILRKTPEMAEREETFEKIKGLSDEIGAQCLLILSESDVLWSMVTDEFGEVALAISESAQRDFTGGYLESAAEHVREVMTTVADTIAGFRQRVVNLCLEVVLSSGVLPPEHMEKAGRLIKAVLTDQMPWYGTIERLLKMVGHVELDEAVWEKLAKPARAALCFRMLESNNAKTGLTIQVARMALQEVKALAPIISELRGTSR